jgi:hypothetical protein
MRGILKMIGFLAGRLPFEFTKNLAKTKHRLKKPITILRLQAAE